MKQKFFFIICILFCISCSDMFDNVREYATEETVYPGQFDTIFYKLGYERAEIDLLKVGRIPSSQINMGKAVKTVIEYDGEKLVIDSVCSWVNLTGLKSSKLYRIKAYTIDEFENKSVPQEVALIPFTSSDVEILSVANPRVIASPWAVSLTWTNISSVLLNYCSLTYSYTDKDGEVVKGAQEENPMIIMENLNAGEEASIDLTYRVVPKVNGEEILDTVYLSKTFYMYMPTSEVYQRELQSRGIKSMIYLASQDIQITWQPVDNHTLMHSTLKYMDTSDPANPVERIIQIDNSETVTLAEGLRIGTPFYVSSNFKPDGVEGVYVDSDFKEYDPETLDYPRTGWTGVTSHSPASDGNSIQNMLDENYSTFLSIAKPGKSVNGSAVPANELAGWTLDLQQSLTIDYYRIRHRDSTKGLRIWSLTMYGSDDNVNWQVIKENIVTTGYETTSVLESPNIPIPRSKFRYLKVEYTDWDTANNSACQLAEFYLGASKNPLIQ